MPLGLSESCGDKKALQHFYPIQWFGLKQLLKQLKPRHQPATLQTLKPKSPQRGSAAAALTPGQGHGETWD